MLLRQKANKFLDMSAAENHLPQAFIRNKESLRSFLKVIIATKAEIH